MISQCQMLSSYLTINGVRTVKLICFRGLWLLMVGYVCLYLIWVLNPGTGSGISNNSYSMALNGEEDMFPVWRRTAMLKINWKDSRWVKGDVQKKCGWAFWASNGDSALPFYIIHTPFPVTWCYVLKETDLKFEVSEEIKNTLLGFSWFLSHGFKLHCGIRTVNKLRKWEGWSSGKYDSAQWIKADGKVRG